MSFARAMLVDIFARSYAQGGSTITQQVVKNALLTQDKSIVRKIEEIILAIRLTRAYPKDQILNTYLNETSYGGTIYGVEEASQFFFGVSAHDVDLAQAAYIAALPAAPTYFSPYGPNRAALDQRKNYVLQQMEAAGYITAAEYQQASTEQVEFNNQQEASAGIKAPHFVFYIINYLEQKYGSDMVENGGLHVITTLDYDLQQHMENTVTKWAPQMKTNFNASNEGMVAVDPKTGQILAMVGSGNYFDDSIDGQVNVTLANRQPGSSFKPFVYATAFEKGYTPDTVVFDLPTQFSTACSPQDTTNTTPPCYSPVNYDAEFKGPISLRDSIAQSRNVPSVKTLYLAGIANSLKTAQDLGITTLGSPSQYGLTLVLGGGEVNLLQMTGAYAVFANDGVKNPPTGILQVNDQGGNVLEQYASNPTRVLDPQIARQVSDILSDDTARAPDFGVHGPLWFSGADVADKTGTTNDSRDAWIIGYTPSISVGAWAGNNDDTPMVKNIAAFIVTPMWHEFVAYAIQKYPADPFPPPAPDPSYDSLPPVLKGDWNTNPSQGVHDILYWVQKDNPRAGPPANPWGDVQAAYWDYPVQLWAAQMAAQAQITPPAATTTVQ
jgi:membrane peptidoglycan carboxypeptidase